MVVAAVVGVPAASSSAPPPPAEQPTGAVAAAADAMEVEEDEKDDDDEAAAAPQPPPPKAQPPPRRVAPPPKRAPSPDAQAQHATLMKMMQSAMKEGRLSQAVDTARRACDLGEAPPEGLLLSLLTSLFEEKTDMALSLYDIVCQINQEAADEEGGGGGGGGGASRALMIAVLDGVVVDKRGADSTYTLRAMDVFNELRASSADATAEAAGDEDEDEEGVPFDLLRKLLKALVKADLLDDAYDVLSYAQSKQKAIEEKAEAAKKKQRAANRKASERGEKDTSGGGRWRRWECCASSYDVGHAFGVHQARAALSRAIALFHSLVATGGPPNPTSGASLLDSLCARGQANDALTVLNGMHDAGQSLTTKLVCQVVTALTRARLEQRAFHVFEKFMENAGSADAFLQSLHSPEWNVEHGLALLTKALSKAMKGRQAHRVYHAAKQAGLVTNYQSYGLPGLTMACVDSGMLQQALGVSEDARQALLTLGMTTASALLTNVAKAKSGRSAASQHPCGSVRAENDMRRELAPCGLQLPNGPSASRSRRGHPCAQSHCGSEQAAACDAGGREGQRQRRQKEAAGYREWWGRVRRCGRQSRACKAAFAVALAVRGALRARREAKAVKVLQGMRVHGVLCNTSTYVLIANACGRRRASAPLSDLSSTFDTSSGDWASGVF